MREVILLKKEIKFINKFLIHNVLFELNELFLSFMILFLTSNIL
jgi:hypothetical protein